MKTAVSHLDAGICQTVFMNSICHPRQRAAAQTCRRGWVVWVCIFRRMGCSGRRRLRIRHPVPSSAADGQAWKALGDIWNLEGGEIAPSLQVLQGLRPGSVGGKSSWSVMFLGLGCLERRSA